MIYAESKAVEQARRTTDALERINEEFRRRTQTQAALPNEEAVMLLLFGLLRSGQIKTTPAGRLAELASSSKSSGGCVIG